MSGMELNKIAAAILLAGLIGMVTSKVTDILYVSEPSHHGEHEVARGYSIPVSEDPTAMAAAPKEEKLPSIIPALNEADALAGGTYFAKRCATCHNVEKGEGNKTGPALYNVVGRDIGSVGGFNYSSALAEEKEGAWGYEELNAFLHKPKKWTPGTIMAFAGMRKEDERANVIAYLRQQADNPPAIPAAPAVEEEPAAEETPADAGDEAATAGE